MLSAFERRQANEDNTLWCQNAAIIRQLYQDERKTLKEVKAIMENEKGFPATPLPTWEVKLRELGIQKKLKAKDWSTIYQHIYPRLQHQGKKEVRKPTVILIHGTKKPWDKCWKEIRRNRAFTQRHHQGTLPPLPNFITIRTPSPELLETFVRRQPAKDVHFLVEQLFQTTVLSLQPLFELDVSSLNEKGHTSTCPTPDSVYKLCLKGIPFTILLSKASGSLLSPHAVVRTGESQDCNDQIIPSSGQPGNFALSGCIDPFDFQPSSNFAQRLSEFMSASSAGQQLGLNFDSHHYLSMIIYLLSNNLLSTDYLIPPEEVTVSEILQMTLKFVSIQLLTTLFQSQLLSIKAAWECLLVGAQKLKNKEAFEFFINIGIKNEWLEPHDNGHEYLYSAAQMNCPEILRALIDRGCRIALYPSCLCWRSESIIVETINNSNTDCAKLLLQNCDVNHEFEVGINDYKTTHFAMFIKSFDDSRLDHLSCLKFLLEQGANVDYAIDLRLLCTLEDGMITSWDDGDQLQKDWPLSILDYVYYFHRASFLELMKFSKTTAQFSRAMALWNLEQGVDALQQYLLVTDPWEGVNNYSSDAKTLERKGRFLEILLAEQFSLSIILPGKTVICSRIAALSELEMNFIWLPKTKHPARIVLYATACLAISEEGEQKEKGLRIMQWLLASGFQVNAEALLEAYRSGGVSIMQYLASFCDDIKVEGGKVLVQAALRNDLSSAKLLLQIGVDPNSSMITTDVREMNVFEAAACGSTLETMKYLVQLGVKPRVGISGVRPSLALIHMFLDRHIHEDEDMFNKVQYIVEEHMMIYEPLWPSSPLLEFCTNRGLRNDLKRKVFEFLLQKGAGLNVGSPLAEWIGNGGRHQVVQQMLGAGADPNAYSRTKYDPDYPELGDSGRTPLQAAAGIGDYTLVCLLLEHGADLNAPASRDEWYTQTALQAICVWDPVRREERLRKAKIVQLLLDKGADVNATNPCGRTALMGAAQLGDISTAFTLLKHGARPNAITAGTPREGPFTALDVAAIRGRLDMVQFLLNANALSSTAWSNGEDYEGAIRLARINGYLVISELINRHSAERHRWTVPSETSVATSLDQKYIHQSLSLRTKAAITLRPQSRTQFTATESPSSTTVLEQIDVPSSSRKEGELESSTAALEAEANDIFMAEVTEVSEPSAIKDIGDSLPLVEAGGHDARGAGTYKTAGQATHTEEVTSGNGAWSYEPTGQSWVLENQQSAVLLAPSSLAEDVFMGFPGFQSL